MPVREYLKGQRRFFTLDGRQIDLIQERVEKRWDALCKS